MMLKCSIARVAPSSASSGTASTASVAGPVASVGAAGATVAGAGAHIVDPITTAANIREITTGFNTVTPFFPKRLLFISVLLLFFTCFWVV
jgi:hypothetical protein